MRAEAAVTSKAADGAAVLACQTAPPDAVVLDMMLPKASGFVVMEKIREMDRPPVVVMVTANQGKRHQQYAHDLGVHAYMNKPVSLQAPGGHHRAASGAAEPGRGRSGSLGQVRLFRPLTPADTVSPWRHSTSYLRDPATSGGNGLAPIGSRQEIVNDLSRYNTASDGTGDEVLYGPGIRIEIPPGWARSRKCS